jgi:hypothetical protein
MPSTFKLARRLGAGADLTDGTDRFLVSDYSPGTGDVYGWRLRDDGTRGAYMKLPADLMESK